MRVTEGREPLDGLHVFQAPEFANGDGRATGHGNGERWILKVRWCEGGDQWRAPVNVVMSLRAP
jgi:hypothetical protein